MIVMATWNKHSTKDLTTEQHFSNYIVFIVPNKRQCIVVTDCTEHSPLPRLGRKPPLAPNCEQIQM
jgi:hypothetical protein